MTIDEAKTWLLRARELAELQAEVERLRAETRTLSNTINQKADDYDAKLAKLEAANAELLKRQEFFDQNVCIIQDRDRELADLRDQLDALGKENAELRAQRDDISSFCDKSVEKMTAKIDKLKATLAWFEERESTVRFVDEKAQNEGYDDLLLWEQNHPKPE